MKLIQWSKGRWKEMENGDFLFDLKNITPKTFDTTAQKWALVIANEGRGVEKNQLRRFYDKVLELHERAQNVSEEEFEKQILPFVKMLRSKAHHGKTRQSPTVNEAFVEFMEYGLGQIDDKKSFENFRYLFEAIMGFYIKDKKNIEVVDPNEKNNRHRHQSFKRR